MRISAWNEVCFIDLRGKVNVKKDNDSTEWKKMSHMIAICENSKKLEREQHWTATKDTLDCVNLWRPAQMSSLCNTKACLGLRLDFMVGLRIGLVLGPGVSWDVRVRGWVINYAYKSHHKHRSTRVCVFVCVCICVFHLFSTSSSSSNSHSQYWYWIETHQITYIFPAIKDSE